MPLCVSVCACLCVCVCVCVFVPVCGCVCVSLCCSTTKRKVKYGKLKRVVVIFPNLRQNQLFLSLSLSLSLSLLSSLACLSSAVAAITVLLGACKRAASVIPVSPGIIGRCGSANSFPFLSTTATKKRSTSTMSDNKLFFLDDFALRQFNDPSYAGQRRACDMNSN